MSSADWVCPTASAYVTLVMRDDKYVAGALVLAQSLRNCRTSHLLICMVTEDIRKKTTRVLKKWYDYVVTVPYIRHKCIGLKKERQRVLYEDWIEESFTKWNCLNPQLYQPLDVIIDKVLFIDADMLVLANCDKELFSLEPPAMTFSLPWAKPYSPNGIHNPYGELSHGVRLSSALVSEQLYGAGMESFVGIASLVLLRPDKQIYRQMKKQLEQKFLFGVRKCMSGFDEQLICDTYCSLNQSFRHIHQCYNWCAGKEEWLSIAEPEYSIPWIIHYYGDEKPWYSSRNSKWDDTNRWWDIADQIIAKDDSTRKFFELRF